jgi:hypothetical protein
LFEQSQELWRHRLFYHLVKQSLEARTDDVLASGLWIGWWGGGATRFGFRVVMRDTGGVVVGRPPL